MTLNFREQWNQIPEEHNAAPDAVMIPLLNIDEETIKVVLNEAHVNGGWQDLVIKKMFEEASKKVGEVVTVRQGAHQVEESGDPNVPHQGAGFRLHIGTSFRGLNYHLNIQQSNSGRMYVKSVSRGAPHTPGYYFEDRLSDPPV